MSEITVDLGKLKILLDQNREMKELITEANQAYEKINSLLGNLTGGNIMLKLPKILYKVNSEPEAFEKLISPDFEARLKKFID